MRKVQALFNAVQRSTKNADEVEDTIGLTFLNPTITRWNSSYFAVKRIVEVGIDGVTACQNKIGLEVFSDDDMQFLKGYVEVMKPLALAMDKLQGEQQCYIGHVILTICGMTYDDRQVSVATHKSSNEWFEDKVYGQYVIR